MAHLLRIEPLFSFLRFLRLYGFLIAGFRGFPFCVDFGGCHVVCFARIALFLPFLRFLRFPFFWFSRFLRV